MYGVSLILSVNAYVLLDTASPDDPAEVSFEKDEIVDVIDSKGKWWRIRTSNGKIGSECTPLYSFFTAEH